MADRALAGLNRVMEQGVEPLARMIWAPTNPVKPDVEQHDPADLIVPLAGTADHR